MQKVSKIVLSSITAFIFIFIGQGVHAESYPVDGEKIILPKELVDEKEKADDQTSISLTNESYVLEGLIDQATFYYDVPVSGLKKDNYLYLNVAYSELLSNGSTITVSVDGERVKSFDLQENKTALDMKVPLTGDTIKRGFHNVSISFYGNLSKDMCANEENPANWLTILPNSHITLQTDDSLLSDRKDVLEDYPYPFIQNNKSDVVQSEIVIPNDPTEEVVTSALQVASYLSNKTTDNEEVKIVQEADVTKVSTHLIAIGSKDQWEGLMKDLFTSMDEPVEDGKIVIRNRFLQFTDVTKQIMFITATKDEKIAENILLLTNDAYIEQLSRSDIAVQTLPEVEKEEIKETVSFKDLQIPNVTLDGLQLMSENYFYYIPTYIDKSADAYVHLQLKVAETLFDDKQDRLSELVVYVNHVPHSIAINDLEETEDGFYKVAIPINANLLQQERYVTIQFLGNGLKEREICVPPTDEEWIFIHEDSYLQVPLVDDTSKDTGFKTWPAPFATTTDESDTTIILGEEFNEKVLTQLQLVTNSLASNGSIDGLRIVGPDVSPEELSDRHVIILGHVDEWKELDQYKEDLLVPTDSEGNFLVDEFGFLNETSKHISFIQPSLWNEEKSLAIFSAVHTNEEAFLNEKLLSFIDQKGTNATIAIQSENGEIFTNKVVEEVERKRSFGSDTETNQSWIMYTFIGILAVGIVVFIFVIRRTRKEK